MGIGFWKPKIQNEEFTSGGRKGQVGKPITKREAKVLNERLEGDKITGWVSRTSNVREKDAGQAK